MFAVTVTFDIAPGQIEAFLPLMKQQAETSLAVEEGCLAFDICRDSTRLEKVFLYEIYTGKPAFDDHLASAHFREFDTAVQGMLAEKSVVTYDRVIVGKS